MGLEVHETDLVCNFFQDFHYAFFFQKLPVSNQTTLCTKIFFLQKLWNTSKLSYLFIVFKNFEESKKYISVSISKIYEQFTSKHFE